MYNKSSYNYFHNYLVHDFVGTINHNLINDILK
jgi:hypothetical protein